MSRLLRAFAASELQGCGLGLGKAANSAGALAVPTSRWQSPTSGGFSPGSIAQRFQAFLLRDSTITHGDLAAVATLLAKRPDDAEAMLAGSGAPASGSRHPEGAALEPPLGQVSKKLLECVALVALPRLAEGYLAPAEAVELLHALSRVPSAQVAEGVRRSSSVVGSSAAGLDPRSLALVANSYARLHLRDMDVLRAVARRGVEVLAGADGAAAASLAHAFAKLRVYHNALFVALKERLPKVLGDLAAAEVASCLFAFVRSLPPRSKGHPLTYAFESHKGFGNLFNALHARLREHLEAGSVSSETALLALQGLSVLHLRDEPLLEGLFGLIDWRGLNCVELCIALHAAAALGAGKFVPVRLDFPGLVAARGERLCILVSALNLLLHDGAGASLDRLPDAAGQRLWPGAIEVALGRAGGPGPSHAMSSADRSATPHVAVACLFWLPGLAGRWGGLATLQGVRSLLSLSKAPPPGSKPSAINSSELQVAVESCTRQVVSRQPCVIRSEVNAAPFWLDIVMSKKQPAL